MNTIYLQDLSQKEKAISTAMRRAESRDDNLGVRRGLPLRTSYYVPLRRDEAL